jgi:hypothetical protein
MAIDVIKTLTPEQLTEALNSTTLFSAVATVIWNKQSEGGKKDEITGLFYRPGRTVEFKRKRKRKDNERQNTLV